MLYCVMYVYIDVVIVDVFGVVELFDKLCCVLLKG